ncbi:protein FAF-like, chloroplastic [Syzygium oleosum]|uniref:protein FAF-like, chloroplastic n=1 Tax=Syzygium oleosum TaxID=219896 RepID=UPI0011D1BFD2|nr:protein FAF-like, chloroplastic [Syzygium oleosum]
MTAFLSQSLGLSPTLKAMVHHYEETKVVIGEKQGITTILGSEPAKPTSSLRRTLSADMSSKKWLSQNGLVFKNALAHIADSSSSSEEDDEEDCYEDKRKESRDLEKSSQFDIWSSIISQKHEEPSVQAPPPYVHPLVRRSASSLSGKSLEICTESLGSETGSDRFSSYPASEMGNLPDEDDKESDTVLQDLAKLQLPQEDQDQQLHFARYSNYAGWGKKRQQPKSFPPPLPSLSRPDGALLRMQSRRDNGRLVLEAISVPSEKNFCVQRQDGRLILTFNVSGAFERVNDDNEAVGEEGEEEQEEVLELNEEFLGFGESDEKEEEEGEDEEMVEVEEEEEEEEEAKKLIFATEDAPPNILASGDVNNVHKIAIMMNKKPMDLANRNPAWPNKFNEEDEPILLPQSLPPLARVARVITDLPPPSTAASFNAYEYFWRTKSTVASATAAAVINPISSAQQQSLALNSYSKKYIVTKSFVSNDRQHQEQAADFWASGIKSCKESRRSLLFWEPHCIATS